MKTIIVDDELKSSENLQILLQNYCNDIEIQGVADNISHAFSLIHECRPELVFLDISMPGGSGFDLLKKIPRIDFELIFVTAHENYGIQAIKSNATDYLLKPLSVIDLQAAVLKARDRISARPSSGWQAPERPAKQQLNKIAIPASDGLAIIALEDIICFTAEGNYTWIILKNDKKILSSRTLKEYENQLPEAQFIRVHHAHIINLRETDYYHRGDGGSVTMSNGMHVYISKRKKKAFLERFSM